MKKKINLNIVLDKPTLVHEKFHEKTKIKKIVGELDPKDWPESWKTVYYKAYPRLNEIVLPEPYLPNIYIKDVFARRKSERAFSKKPLSLSDLSSLLFYSAGIKNSTESFQRFYPSAGGRYPLEVYALCLNTDFQRGLYHYYLKNHSLEELLTFEGFDFDKYFIQQKWIPKVPCFIIITAVFKRNTVKYGDRGYRHILAESGHLGQNFYLVSAALNLACCAIGGYLDDKINELLDIDGIEESVVYVLAIGNA